MNVTAVTFNAEAHRAEVQSIIDSLDAAAEAIDLSSVAHVRTALVSLRDEPKAAADPAAAYVDIADLDVDGPAPEADDLRALLSGVALPVQKAYGAAKKMREAGRTSEVFSFKTRSGDAHVVEITVLPSGAYRLEVVR